MGGGVRDVWGVRGEGVEKALDVGEVWGREIGKVRGGEVGVV